MVILSVRCFGMPKTPLNAGMRSRQRVLNLEKVAERVAGLFGMKAEDVWLPGKNRKDREWPQSVIAYWAVKELGETMTSMARRLNISVTAVGQSVARGEALVKEGGYLLLE